MADLTPGHDPLGDRLRATFAAEHADIERRHRAQGAVPKLGRSMKWIPFAAAAAVIALAGFFFLNNRSTDTAVDLDVAAQTDDRSETTGREQATVESVTTPTPVEEVLVRSGMNLCADGIYDEQRVFPWATPPMEGTTIQTAPTPERPLTAGVAREIAFGVPVKLAGGCVTISTPLGEISFYELDPRPDQPLDWIAAEHLLTASEFFQRTNEDQAAIEEPSPPPVNGCGELPLAFPFRFIWSIGAEDPDGGLVAHTEPGVDAPVTRIIQLDEIVVVTGECERTANGSPWYELRDPVARRTDWVSGNYLMEPGAACLSGEQFGTRDRQSRVVHNIAAGDTLGGIAQRYGGFLEVLLQANPSVDPSSLRIGQAVWIPGQLDQGEQIFGPIEGLAIQGGDGRVGFAPIEATTGEMRYRWYPAAAITTNQPCFASGEIQAACLTGRIELLDPQSPEPIWIGDGPIEVTTTGRVVPREGSSDGWPEVAWTTRDGADLIGLIDTNKTPLEPSPCPTAPGGDSFAEAPCNALESEVVVGSTTRGSQESTADHVHNIRVERGADSLRRCVRVVIEFGQGLTTDGADTAADLLPNMVIEKKQGSTRILLPPWTLAAFDEPSRVDYDEGIALLTTTAGFRPAVEVLQAQPGETNVWFLENPARVIIDTLTPPPLPDDIATGPFGQNFVLRSPIQSSLRSRGIPSGQPVIVEGFGRPFEAQGLYRVYEITPSTDLDEFWASDPEPLVEEVFLTAGWADGWGEFAVQLPVLEPGTYVAVFGEVPPTDEIVFIGTGQVFRVFDPTEPETRDYPSAALLPDVRITAGGE